MLYYKDNKWNISELIVKFTNDGEIAEQFVGVEGRRWWLDLEKLHEGIEIISFADVDVTESQLTRLEEVNNLNIKDGHSEILGDYVINGNFPTEIEHTLRPLQIVKEQLTQDEYLLDLEFRQTMQEMGV